MAVKVAGRFTLLKRWSRLVVGWYRGYNNPSLWGRVVDVLEEDAFVFVNESHAEYSGGMKNGLQ